MLAPVLGNPHFVKVLDFGLAKAVSDVAGFDATVSRTGQFLGTPCYMAPEQAPRKGQPAADGRSDLYAVAVMLYETFTGVVPFDGQTPLEVLTKKVDPRHDPLAHPEARGLPPSIRAFLRKGMAADPELRFGTAEEMLAALGQALSGRAAAASGPERTARRRHGRGLLRVAAPAVLVAVLAGAAAAWLARDTRPQEAAATVVEPGPPEAPTPTPAPEQPAPASPPTAAEPVAATIPVASPTGMRVRFESDPTGAEVSAGGSARERQPGRLPGHGCASARARRWSSPEAS
jgi:serine/threonine-protein kinase